jgi:hypothetical protein
VPMLSRLTYPEILDRLEALKEYVTKLRVHYIPNRLCGAIANVRELDRARRENRLEHLVTSYGPASPDRRVQELVWSVVEAQQLATIFEGLHDCDPKIVRRPLLKALTGPLHPIDETGSTNVGRNTIFELLLNSMFQRAGASVTIGKEADLQVDHSGARLYIECKRPMLKDSIPNNVSKARRQLQYRFKIDRRSSEPANEVGGLVAISISKALNPGLQMFFVDKEEGLKELGNDITSIRRQYPDDHNRQDDFRLVGMFYHLFTPAYVRSTGLLTCASETHIFVVKESFQEAFPLSGQPLKQLLQRFELT